MLDVLNYLALSTRNGANQWICERVIILLISCLNVKEYIIRDASLIVNPIRMEAEISSRVNL